MDMTCNRITHFQHSIIIIMKDKNIILTARKWIFGILTSLPLGGLGWALTSCDDFFNQESNDVLYADQEHLKNPADTAYSVVGILGKLQTIADRTVLLGEVRGDLVDLTLQANSDLRDVANFNVGDDNRYNQPSDYYAIINNCNYFVAHVDTSMRTGSSIVPTFMAEYAAVKAIRAWTYLQLALNYGRVPLFTTPLLNREAAEAAEKGRMADIEEICTFFLDDLSDIPVAYNNSYPLNKDYVNGLRNVKSTELLFFPLSLLRGELYLWRASVTGSVSDYRQAALNYFQFISKRNGQDAAYATGSFCNMWDPGTTTFNVPTNLLELSYNDAPITIIPGNSSPADGAYSQLYNLFYANSDNNYKVSIEASKRIFDISEAQDYCLPSTIGKSFTIAPKGLTDYQSGDLRLSSVYRESSEYDPYTEERIRMKGIRKHLSNNVTIYRCMTVYLHLAEALNGAGFPRMAFLILSRGLTNKNIQKDVIPYHVTEDGADTLFLKQFNFDDQHYHETLITQYIAAITYEDYQLGIHTRGSGWTPENPHYILPNDTIEPDLQKRQQLVAEQQAVVDSLLLNEEALELAFEGTRYYDLMRFAMRQDNPAAFMAQHVFARRGEAKRGEVQGEVKTDFTDRSTWFLHWNGKIGF